jgi:Na+-driven multidrug efflux pump
MGPAEVATWAIVGSVWDIFEASTEGIGDAAEIRSAYHLGKGNPEMARLSSYKSLLLGMIFSFLITSVFFIIGDDIAAWFTKDLTLQLMITELIPLVGIGNITMTFGMICWALVGSQGKGRIIWKAMVLPRLKSLEKSTMSCYQQHFLFFLIFRSLSSGYLCFVQCELVSHDASCVIIHLWA